MATYTDAQKALMNHDDTMKNVVISFPGTSIPNIENDKIYLESMYFEESLLDQDEIQFGRCNLGMFQIQVADFGYDIIGKTINVAIELSNETLDEEMTYQLGKFIVNGAERTADRRWRIITAVDFMSKFDVNIADWYKNTLFPEVPTTTRTMSEIFTMLCTYIGVSYDDTVGLPFGDVVISRMITVPNSINALRFLEDLLEINVRFGHFDENGVFKLIKLEYDDNQDVIDVYKNINYEDYTTRYINEFHVTDDTHLKASAIIWKETPFHTAGGNPYWVDNNQVVIYSNFFDDEEIFNNLDICKSEINDCQKYTPNELTAKGLMYMELGLPYTVTTNDGVTFDSFVLKREMNGIQALFTTIITQGKKGILSKDHGDAAGQNEADAKAVTDRNTEMALNSIKSDVIHYLATSQSEGVTTETTGWTTTPQTITPENKYLWTYHTYTYNSNNTEDTEPVITGVYGDSDSVDVCVTKTSYDHIKYDGNNLIRNSNTYDFDDYYFSGNLMANNHHLILSNGNKMDVKIGGY